jgi:hypothetical protein
MRERVCVCVHTTPPPWMSIRSPKSALAIVLHSMCQPGRPGPHGEFHAGSPLHPVHSVSHVRHCI